MNNVYLILLLLSHVLFPGCASRASRTDSTQTQEIAQRIDLPRLEQRIHALINEERRKKGLNPLKWDDKLARIARKHSEDMARNNYFSHVNQQGQDPTERARKQHYKCFKDYGTFYTVGIAENIFLNYLFDRITYLNNQKIYHYLTLEEIARSTVQGWMESPGHRSNILHPRYDREGIGVAVSGDGIVYITQDFC